MALFSNKPKKETKKEVKPRAARTIEDKAGRLEGVLKHPWLSEKALIGTENGVYVFAVPTDATKTEIAEAVEKIYKVSPRKIAIVNLPAKRKALRHKRGMGSRAARHKAYVYLSKGESIQFA